MKVKVSGPQVRSLSRAIHLAKHPSSVAPDSVEMPNGDIYFHIHLSWKALAACGLIIAQSAVALIRDQFHLFT